jgi:hypothetical protein
MSYKINILRWFAIAADVREALELLKSIPGDTLAAKVHNVTSALSIAQRAHSIATNNAKQVCADLARVAIERDELKAFREKMLKPLRERNAARAASKAVSDVVEKGL